MKQIELTRKQIAEAFRVFGKVGDKVVSPKLAFFFIRNKSILKDEVEAIAKAQQSLALTPEIEEYNRKQQALDPKSETFKADSDKIYADNKELVDGYRKRDAEFTEMLGEKVSVNVVPVKVSELPEDLLTVSDLEAIADFVEEE